MARKQLRLTAFGSYPILANIHFSTRDHSPARVDSVSFPPALMLVGVAKTAKQLQVVEVQADGWVLDVCRREMNLVVNDLARRVHTLGQTPLT